MIVFDFKQGSPEWLAIRTGIPTASRFGNILTAKTRKPSASAARYMCDLIAERIIGSPVDTASSEFMLRGSAMESEAVAAYEFEHDCECKAVGFVMDDSRRWGCSPDRLVGDDGLLEIKCPSAGVHVAALLGMQDDEHAAQAQGQLWITGRAWVDLMYYNPLMPTHTVRIERDEEHIGQIAAAVRDFCDRLDAAHSRIVGGEVAVMDATREPATAAAAEYRQ